MVAARNRGDPVEVPNVQRLPKYITRREQASRSWWTHSGLCVAFQGFSLSVQHRFPAEAFFQSSTCCRAGRIDYREKPPFQREPRRFLPGDRQSSAITSCISTFLQRKCASRIATSFSQSGAWEEPSQAVANASNSSDIPPAAGTTLLLCQSR